MSDGVDSSEVLMHLIDQCHHIAAPINSIRITSEHNPVGSDQEQSTPQVSSSSSSRNQSNEYECEVPSYKDLDYISRMLTVMVKHSCKDCMRLDVR